MEEETQEVKLDLTTFQEVMETNGTLQISVRQGCAKTAVSVMLWGIGVWHKT